MTGRTAGISLMEMALALALAGMVGAAGAKVVLNSLAALEWQAQRLATNRELRAASSILSNEIRGSLGSAGGGLLVIDSNSVIARLSRGFGVSCYAGTTGVVLDSSRLGFRLPQPGRDSLMMFVEGADTASGHDDRWEVFPLLGVSAGNCPDGSAGLALASPIGLLADSLDYPGYVGVFTSAQFRRYQSLGRYWLGLKDYSATDPVAGPLTAPTGRLFQGLDQGGSALPDGIPASHLASHLTLMSLGTARYTFKTPRRHYRDSLISFVIPRSGSIYP